MVAISASFRFEDLRIETEVFDAEAFAQAIHRARADGLIVQPGRAPRSWWITHPKSLIEIVATSAGCTCHASSLAGSDPCRHLAVAILLDAQVRAGRPARLQVPHARTVRIAAPSQRSAA